MISMNVVLREKCDIEEEDEGERERSEERKNL